MAINNNSYNMSNNNLCILENTLVRVYEDDREQYIPVQNIKKGTCILNNNTSTFVRCVVKTKYSGPICIFGDYNELIGITPYHPIKYSNNWVFPINCDFFQKVNMTDVYVYNFFLETIHEIEFYHGFHGITLNHGMEGPIVSHNYFGTNMVEYDFMKHPEWKNGYIQIDNIKAIRDPITNQVISLDY